MLVLTRKRGECIKIGDEILITVLEVRGDRVRLGIEAPREIDVRRYEIYAAAITQHNAENGFTAEPVTTEPPSVDA